MTAPHSHAQQESLDIREFGAPREGAPQALDRRLFIQLQVFTGCLQIDAAIRALKTSGLESVLYTDLNDPQGIGVLLMSEDPSLFAESGRNVLSSKPFSDLKLRGDLTMLGRTYAMGRETDLEEWLLKKPKKNVTNAAWPWAIWYPLRRTPDFALLSREEQGKILGEHAMIGRTYGMADFAHDVRLACHGLDQKDNEFVIGLIGKDLYPLSRVVQDMRKTQQTARYIQSLGPFFVGKAVWQSPINV